MKKQSAMTVCRAARTHSSRGGGPKQGDQNPATRSKASQAHVSRLLVINGHAGEDLITL